MRFFFDYKYVRTVFNAFSLIYPPKYVFLKPLPPIFFLSKSNKFFSIAIFYSYLLLFHSFRIINPNCPLIEDYKNLLAFFSSSTPSSPLQTNDSITQRLQFLTTQNSFTLFKGIKSDKYFPRAFFFIYYGKIFYYAILEAQKSASFFINYARFYFTPLYFTPFYATFLSVANAFFHYSHTLKFARFTLITLFFLLQLWLIFFSPVFFLFVFFGKFGLFFMNTLAGFFFNPFKLFLQRFYLKFTSLFSGFQWSSEALLSHFETMKGDKHGSSVFQASTPDTVNATIKSTENVKYKVTESADATLEAQHFSSLHKFFSQLDFFFFSVITKLIRNYEFKPFFSLNYTHVNIAFRKLNKRVLIFLYEKHALETLREQFFPLTQSKSLKRNYWFFNSFPNWASTRTYPFIRFTYFLDFVGVQLSYYLYRITLNFKQFNNFASRLVLFSFFRNRGRRFVLIYLRIFVLSFFVFKNSPTLLVLRKDKTIASFEKPYFYTPFSEFYTIFSSSDFSFTQKFYTPFSLFPNSSQFYIKLFLSRLLTKRISNVPFSAYLTQNNLTSRKFSFDPLFQIFTNYHIFNTFFPIFSYLGFDYLYDKNVFRDRHLLDKGDKMDLILGDSPSAEFYDFNSESANSLIQTSNRTDQTTFHDFMSVDSFTYYEDFSHLTYFFGYYTDFFFKFVFWPKIITKNVYLSDTYFYFHAYFSKTLKKNLIPAFLYYILYLDIFFNVFHFVKGSLFSLQTPVKLKLLYLPKFVLSCRFFTPFFFYPVKANFLNFYYSSFYYSNFNSLLSEHSEITEEERSFDLGHNSEDFSTLADVDRFQLEEDIATDYTNHLLEEQYYSTYIDDEDFRFPEFNAFDAYVFGEEVYEPTYMDDELQIALDFAYEAEFGIFFNIFEESQYQELDENIYEIIMDFFDAAFLMTRDKAYLSTFYIQDDTSVEDQENSLEDVFDPDLEHETDDASGVFVSKKSLTVFKNYTIAYTDYITKWAALQKTSQMIKYKKLPPFLYGIGRYTKSASFLSLYKKIIYGEKNLLPFSYKVFSSPLSSSRIVEALFKQFLSDPLFIEGRFSNEIKLKQFFLVATNVFNLPIFLFPKDPYLTNFILAQQIHKYFGSSILSLEHFSATSNPIKTPKYFENFNLFSSFFQNFVDLIFSPIPLDKPTRFSEYYFGTNKVPVYSFFSFLLNFIPYFFQRYVFIDKSVKIPGGNWVEYENPVLRNTKFNEDNIMDPTPKLPRIDEWLIYQSPSIIDLPHTYLVDPIDRLWYTIYFNNQIRGYKRVNDYYMDLVMPKKVNVFRPLVYIRALRKFMHEDEVYSYAKRLRRRLYEIRNSNKYPFMKDGYRVAELLDPKVLSYKKLSRQKLFYFPNFQNVNDWTGHPEFKAYQALSDYLNNEFSELIFPDITAFLSRIRFRKSWRVLPSTKIFNFSSYRKKNFFRRRLKRLKLFATLLFSSFSPFITFDRATAPYKFGINFETFYYVRDPALKDPVKFIDFDDVEESPYLFFTFFNSFFSSFQHYRVFDTFLFPYHYTFPFGNFFYDHEVFDLEEDENQEFSSFDFYILEEPDSDSASESFEDVENDSGSYSDLVDFSYDDEFDDTAAFYDLEKDIDNSKSSDNQPVLGTTLYDNPIPETGSEKADVVQSAVPFDSDIYDELYILNDFVEFDEGYHNVSRLEYYEMALLEELVCQLYEKYINVLETYPVDFFPPKAFNWSSLSYQIFATDKASNLRNPRNVDDLFDEIYPNGERYKEPDKKYFWAFGEKPIVKFAHLQSKVNRFNRKTDRRILAILKILQLKYAKRYPKTLDPYYFRRFELFLDDFFNLPEFGNGRYFNIFKIHMFSNEISEAEIFDWFEDNNLDYHNLTLTDFFENIDFENDDLDPDAFEFWAETTTPIARFFFGYARPPLSLSIASDNRFFFTAKLNLSDQNYATASFPFSKSTTELDFNFKSSTKQLFFSPFFDAFKKIAFYIFYIFKAFFIWYYYYCFLLRPEIQFKNSFKALYLNHFSKYDKYYSRHYFAQLYDFLKKWDTNFNLTPTTYAIVEHEYFSTLQNPASYSVSASSASAHTNVGSLSPYLARLFSYFDEPEFEYYLDEFFLDNEQMSNLRSRSFKHHALIDYNSKSNFANILNTFFFWNYDELFYEELGKFFDDTSYDENLLYTHSPMYTSEFLPETSLDESIDFAPFIEELYATDEMEFDSRITMFLEFLSDLVQIYSTIFLDYCNSLCMLSFTAGQASFTIYEHMWLRLFALYGPVTFFARAAFSFSFFLVFFFYALFIIPYLVFFYLPFINYFLIFFSISTGLFVVISCLFYAFSKIFRNFYKTLSVFEFEVFFLSLAFCWFEHVYWGNHIYPVNTVEVFDNPLMSPNSETELFAPYQTLNYRRLGEKTYNSYFISPYHIHLNVRQYRQVLRSFIFSTRINTPELYSEILSERDRFSRSYKNINFDTEGRQQLSADDSVVFYPDYEDLFYHGDLPISNFSEWTQFDDGFYIDFLNRGITYIFTFEDFKKIFWELFLPLTKPYYVHQYQRRVVNDDKKWISIIRRYHNLFALSFGNNNKHKLYRRFRKHKGVYKRLQRFPGRLETPFHYMPQAYQRRYVEARKLILQGIGAHVKLLGPNIFPHQPERRIRQFDADGSTLIRRFNRYSPFYNLSSFEGDYAQYFNNRDVYSPFVYTMSKFLQPSEFSLKSKLSNVFENRHYRFPFRFFKNSNSVIDYRKGRGGLFIKHYILDKRHIQSFGGNIFNRFKLRQKDASAQLAYTSPSPRTFLEASNMYENSINLASEKHVKKSVIVKSYYYNLYRSGNYNYPITQPSLPKLYFSNHFKFSTDFNLLYYHYSKRAFKIFYNSRSFSYQNPHVFDDNFHRISVKKSRQAMKNYFYRYVPSWNKEDQDVVNTSDVYQPTFNLLMDELIVYDRYLKYGIGYIHSIASSYPKKTPFLRSRNRKLLSAMITRRARIYDSLRSEQTMDTLKVQRYENGYSTTWRGYFNRFVRYFPGLVLGDSYREAIEDSKIDIIIRIPLDEDDEFGDLAASYALDRFPTIIEPIQFTKLEFYTLKNFTFFQSLLITLAGQRNNFADQAFKLRQQEKTRLDFNRFLFNKKDFFSRFSFYDVSPIYTSNSPLSKLLINDFFGFDFYTRSSRTDIPPVTDPFTYYRRGLPHKLRESDVAFIPTRFHNLYNPKGQFSHFHLNLFDMKRKVGIWPNPKKLRFFKESIDLWPYHFDYFYDEERRFVPRAFNVYSSLVTSETFFTRGPRELRLEMFIPTKTRRLFGIFPIKSAQTDSDRLRFHNWSVNVNSRLMRDYFTQESFKFEFFTHNIRSDSPYIYFMQQYQPPATVYRHFKKQVRAAYTYPFYSTITPYRDAYKFALRRPEEPTREREEVIDQEDYQSEIETVQLNLYDAAAIIGSSNKRRWETMFHRIHHATAFRAFFEYPSPQPVSKTPLASGRPPFKSFAKK